MFKKAMWLWKLVLFGITVGMYLKIVSGHGMELSADFWIRSLKELLGSLACGGVLLALYWLWKRENDDEE